MKAGFLFTGIVQDVLLVGKPGCGKSTLMENLLIRHKMQDFEAVGIASPHLGPGE
jgi:ABC-type nitrate/sulfonate/bicarbonate transport system ATPase subunit